jgi:hypothetical protein
MAPARAPGKKFRGDDQFARPFPPYMAQAMSACIEADGASPWRSSNNLE